MDCSEVEKELAEITKDYVIIEEDISNENMIPAIYDKVEASLGKVNILINNAATYAEKDTIFSIENESIKNTYSVNVQGTIMMIREFIKRQYGEIINDNKNLQEVLVSHGIYKNGKEELSYGRIINFSTDSAQIFAGQIIYGSSKVAIEALTLSIAMEVGYLGVTVNAVAPGPTQTGWINNELEKTVLPQIPMGRIGTPQDIADTVLFLSSDKASWLTGQVIKVSGCHAL